MALEDTHESLRPEQWENYGDVNPEKHGGLFLTWDGDMWKIVETMRGAGVYYIEPQDVWVDGDPEKGFTDRALEETEALSHHRPDPETAAGAEIEETATFVKLVITGLALNGVGRDPYHRTESVDGGYWDYLSHNFGIEPENVGGNFIQENE